ncbi:MAG: hypothetical protein WA982_10135 [Rubrobacteraceae bacterium]
MVARRSRDSPEVAREAAQMLDLAISRCRAGRYSDDCHWDRVLTILRATRQDLHRIMEEPDLDASLTDESSDGDYTAHPETAPVKNGHN